MIFTLEALQAEYGDSLLLHWNTRTDVRRLLIDGGPPSVWRNTLRGRLQQLRQAGNGAHGDAPLALEMVMVSHIDEDHVGGLVNLGRELKDQDAEGLPLTLDIKDLWHNTFEDLLDDEDAPAALAAVAGLPSTAAAHAVAQNLPLREAAAVISSVNQGRELRDAARALTIPINRAFRGRLIQRPTRAKPRELAGGLTLEIIGPRRDRLDALQKEWHKTRKKRALSAAQIAAFLDDSTFNLASIIAIARAGGRSMLLTGDARGDDILEGLGKAKLLKEGKVHFDLFKVPHHGSVHNVREDFLRVVTADHYVISANGRFDNPDTDMLKMLVAARGRDAYTIHLTNPVPHALKTLKSLKKKANFTLMVRADAQPSLLVELGEKLPARLRP